MYATRNQFTHGALLTLVRDKFHQFTKSRNTIRHKIPITDCFMSALACFSLKYPSLLQFDKEASSRNSALCHNLKTLYGVEQAPCDTQMRERLDHMDLTPIRQAMKAIVARLQRGKVLDQWKFLGQYYVVSLDGTGFFSSHDIHCKQCCEKHHRNGTITYHHQMVVGAVVNPSMKQVLPIGFEPIVKSDGDKKNDCERNASKRWLAQFRQDHPLLPTVVVADGLSSNDPFITMLEEHRCHYILVCKQDDHTYLWDWFNAAQAPDITVMEETVEGVQCTYRFMKDVPLNASSNKRVTIVHYKEVHPNGKTYSCGWCTDLEVTPQNVRNIVKGGRSRWKIENETFNTLKNQGYNFEHNYGHGENGLSNLLAGLMLTAFLVDQCLELVNKEFQEALKKAERRRYLHEYIRARFQMILFQSWEEMYASILAPPRLTYAPAIG